MELFIYELLLEEPEKVLVRRKIPALEFDPEEPGEDEVETIFLSGCVFI
jgi:hypothetical protein